jgi:hypothetical protein
MGIQEIAVGGFACCDLRRAVLAAFGGHPVSPVLGSVRRRFGTIAAARSPQRSSADGCGISG